MLGCCFGTKREKKPHVKMRLIGARIVRRKNLGERKVDSIDEPGSSTTTTSRGGSNSISAGTSAGTCDSMMKSVFTDSDSSLLRLAGALYEGEEKSNSKPSSEMIAKEIVIVERLET